MEAYLIPILNMGAIGAVLAAILVFADAKLKVEEDPRVTQVHEVLPGANCGACGVPGCHQFAEQVVLGTQSPAGCNAGGPDVAKMVADILGVEVEIGLPMKARLMCLGGRAQCGPRAEYRGIQDCRAAALVSGGGKGCVYGCLGYGSCVQVCPFGAMSMDENGLPRIRDLDCTGCGLCVGACPRNLIKLVAEDSKIIVACSSPEKGKIVKTTCSNGCIGCALCAKVCPRGAISMAGNLPVIDQEKCDGCGVCLEKCPTDTLLEAGINGIIIRQKKQEAV